MTKVSNITNYLLEKYPINLASNFDLGKVGLQFGSMDHEVKKAMIALDGSTPVVEDAIAQGVDLLITHHPFMFNSLSNLNYDNPLTKRICLVIKNELNVFAMHTNFDVAVEGMNEILADILGLENIKSDQSEIDNNAFLRYGTVVPMPLSEFANVVKTKFGESHIRIVGDDKKNIKKVGIIGGGGSFDLYKAALHGCDVFITGEIRHNHALDALDLGIALIEVSHSVERLFREKVRKMLIEKFPDVTFVYSEKDVDPFH